MFWGALRADRTIIQRYESLHFTDHEVNTGETLTVHRETQNVRMGLQHPLQSKSPSESEAFTSAKVTVFSLFNVNTGPV